MIFIGVDPGKTGALCAFSPEIKTIEFLDWPKDDDIRKIMDFLDVLDSTRVRFAILEKVHAMPKQGVSSMFSFGRNYGIWEAVLVSYDIPYQTLPPQSWMKDIVYKSDGDAAKIRSIKAIRRLLPWFDAEQHLYGKKGAYKDGRADALLMAYKAMLMSGNQPIKVRRTK